MSEDVTNPVLEHLKVIRRELASVKATVEQINERLRSHDTSILDLRRSDVHAFEEQARHQVHLDRLTDRVERIERRLELQD